MRSPTAATSRRTRPSATSRSSRPDRIATVVGRYYAMDRDKRWRAHRARARGDPRRRGRAARRSGRRRCARATRAGSPTSSSSRSCSRHARGSTLRVDAAIFFNFRPDRGRQLSRRLLERGVDLTTMTRYAEDIPTPGRVPGAGGRGHARRGRRAARHRASCTRPRRRSTRTSPTSSTAARSRSGRARRASSSPRRATSPSYDLKPEMSAAGVAAEVVAALADGYGFCVVNFANPDMVGPHRRDPRRRPRRRGGRRGPRPGRRARRVRSGASASSRPTTATPRQMLEADGVSPHTAHTTNPVPLVVTAADVELRAGGEPRRPRSDGPRPARNRHSRRDDRSDASSSTEATTNR